MKRDNNSKRTLRFLGGMCLGLCIGVSLGIVMENMYLWSLMGLGIGLCFGVAFSKKGKAGGEKTDDENVENQDGNNNT